MWTTLSPSSDSGAAIRNRRSKATHRRLHRIRLMEHTPQPTAPHAPTRRGFLFWITAALGAVAAAMFAVPFVGYLLGVRPRKTEWVPIGEAESFPAGETRMVTFDNPLKAPWD